MSEQMNEELVKVYETKDISTTAIIKSLLEAEGIEYFLRGEHMQSMLGADFIFAPGVDIGKVEIFVRSEDVETAKEIIFPQ